MTPSKEVSRVILQKEDVEQGKGRRLCDKDFRPTVALLLFFGLLSSQRVLAHTCPTDASDTGVGVLVSMFRVNPDGTTGPPVGSGSVGICECLRLRMQIVYVAAGPSGGKVAFFEGGTMRISTFSGSFSDDVTPATGVPLIGNPADPNAAKCGPDAVPSFLSDFSADYCVRASDIDASGKVSFLASYVGGLQHFGSDVLDQPRGTTAISVHVDLGPGCSIQPESQTVCQGVSATFTATGSGQAPPLSFTWTGPNSFTASGATITATDAGNYTATVIDAHGCQSTCTAALALSPNPTCDISGDSSVCSGTTHSYSSTVSPAGGKVTHSWLIGGEGTINGSTTDAMVSVTAGGSDSFTLTDNITRDGCPGRCNLTVTVNPCNPKICVTKGVVCVPSSGVCGDGLPYGDTVTGMNGAGFCYRILIENCGNDVLNDVTVTDPDIGSGPLPGFPTTLAIGESATNFFPKTWSTVGTHVNTATGSGVGVSSGLRTDATDTATVVVVPVGVESVIQVSSPSDQDNNPNDNHVTLPDSGPVRFALTINNTGQVDLSVAISGLPCTRDVNGNPMPTTVTIAAGQSAGPFVCDVDVTCPDGAIMVVRATGTAIASATVPCVLDSHGQPISTSNERSGVVECQAACALSVTETACVVTNAPAAGESCMGGAIALTLKYTGPAISSATIVQVEGSGGTTVAYSLPSLNPGDILTMASENGFTIDATAHGASKLGAQTTVTINSSYEVLHTSCSCRATPETNLKVCNPMCLDASSPDNPTGTKGPASPLWTLVALRDPTLGIINCPTATDNPGSTDCSTVLLPSQANSNCKGKIHSLGLGYVGGGCAATQNSQDAGKVTCTASVNDPGASPVRIRVTDGGGGKVYLDTGTPANVELGAIISLVAGPNQDDSFAADMVITLLNANNTAIEQVKLKSDCSQPLGLGDLYGGLKVIGMTSHDGGTVSLGAQVNYTFEIKNGGGVDLTDVTVVDDALGPISGSPIALLKAGETVTLKATVLVTEPITNTVTVTGNQAGRQCTATATAAVTKAPNPCPCVLGYPFVSDNPRTSVIFSESEVLRAFSPNVAGPGDTLKVWYNDEHALTLGVRRVMVKTSSGTTTNDYPLTPLPSVPGSALNPQVGSTALTGDQAGTDLSERPMRPALFITDITLDPTSRSGDWQFGGTPITPQAIFGAWKGAVRVVDRTVNPPKVTVTPDADPATKNDTLGDARLGSGGDIPPLGFAAQYPTTGGSKSFNEGYTFEARWNIADLIAAGIMEVGHVYRVQFMVHDGDQNKAGGDVGENCATVALAAQVDCPPPPILRECTSGIVGFLVEYTGPDLPGPTTITFTGSQSASVTATYSFPGGLANATVLSLAAESDPGRLWTIDATKHGQTKLGTKTSVYFNNVLTEILHTSCSCRMNNFVPGLPACLDASSPDNPTGTKGEPSPLFQVLNFK